MVSGLVAMSTAAAWAQPVAAPDPSPQSPFRSAQSVMEVNRQRAGLVTGQADLTYVKIGNDIARIVDTDGQPPFRLIVQLGYGSIRNIDDLRTLAKVDFALVQSDVLEAYKANTKLQDELRRQVRVVATLYREKIHILARGDLQDIRSLAGKKVNIGDRNSGHNLTARNLFRRAGVSVEFDESDTRSAAGKLNDGWIHAVVFVTGSPLKAVTDLDFNAVKNGDLHFIPLGDEFKGMTGYEPDRIVHADYNAIVAPLQHIPTLSVKALLVANDWRPGDPKFKAADRFIDLFFSNAKKLTAANFSPDTGWLWCQTDLSGTPPGWRRLPYADHWLRAHGDVAPALKNANGANCP